MNYLLRLLLTLFTILCGTTISGASIQEPHAGAVFEKTCVVFEGETPFSAEFVAPKTGGRGKHKLTPDPKANGDHTVFKTGDDGKVYKYETYQQTPTGHFNPTKRYDGGRPDGTPGAPHINKKTGDSIPTPHVQGKKIPGGARPARPDEIPQ